MLCHLYLNAGAIQERHPGSLVSDEEVHLPQNNHTDVMKQFGASPSTSLHNYFDTLVL